MAATPSGPVCPTCSKPVRPGSLVFYEPGGLFHVACASWPRTQKARARTAEKIARARRLVAARERATLRGRPNALHFDIYGRFTVEVIRAGGRWSVYRLTGEGKRVGAGVPIAASTPASAVGDLLDAYFHELARPGTAVRRVR